MVRAAEPFAVRDPEPKVEDRRLLEPRASRKCSVAYGIYLAWREYSSRREAGYMLNARSVRIGLCCGAMAIAFTVGGQAQDPGKPQETAGPSGGRPQSPEKSQEKCCRSAAADAKPGGEQAAPKLSSAELFAARARIILESGQPAKGDWGLLIADGSTGRVLFEENADKYFVPASNMKLFTTALALAKLSPDFRFQTTIEATADPDT